jgi:hypothetical protein
MRFQGRVGKGLILPTGGEAALLGGQRYRFCPPYSRNLVVVLRACLGTVVSAIFREGINPSPTKITGGGGRSGGVYPRLSLPASGNIDFPNKL